MWSASFCHFPRTECSNICFTFACSQAVRSVWEFKIGFEAFHSLKKMRNSIYQYLQKPNSDSPVKDTNKDAFFGTIDVAGNEIITNIFAVLTCLRGTSQVLNQMLDKDIICHILPTSIVLLLCPHCTAEPSCESYTPAFCSKKEEKRKQSRTCNQTSHWKYHCQGGTFEGVLELYYTFMTSSHPFWTYCCAQQKQSIIE